MYYMIYTTCLDIAMCSNTTQQLVDLYYNILSNVDILIKRNIIIKENIKRINFISYRNSFRCLLWVDRSFDKSFNKYCV